MTSRIHLFAAFFVGACAGSTSGLIASPEPAPAPAPVPPAAPAAPLVLSDSDAARVQPPHKKATLTRYASGPNAFLGKLELDAHVEIPPHRDATEEYIVVLSGGGTLMIDGTPHQLFPGSSVFMPANAEVSYANGPATLVAFQVFAGPSPAAKYDTWTSAI